MPLSQIFAHLTLGDVVFLVGVAFAIGTGLHLIALKLASRGWTKTAHTFDALSVLFLNAVSFARKVAAATGRELPVMTVAQTVAQAEGRIGVRVMTQPVPPSAAIAVLFALSMAVAGHGCSGSPLQVEMHAADSLGLAANRAEPLWLHAYRLEGRTAVDRACPLASNMDAACIAARHAAADATERRWVRVRDQWEVARDAHDAYATCLESAATHDGGVCPDAEAQRIALASAMLAYRCEVHAVGHAELDALGNAPLTCGSDGGVQ